MKSTTLRDSSLLQNHLWDVLKSTVAVKCVRFQNQNYLILQNSSELVNDWWHQASADCLWTAALWPQTLWKAQRPFQSHSSSTTTLTPQLALGCRDSGTDRQQGRGGVGVRGPNHRHSELTWAVETDCQPYCPTAPSFLYLSPTLSSLHFCSKRTDCDWTSWFIR